jgi:hypothetical protein
MRRNSILVGAASVALIAACQDQPMTGVDRSVNNVQAERVVQSSNAENAQYAIDDVMERIVPALSDADAAQGLVAAMRGLQHAVDAGSGADASGLARTAQLELERYARGADADPAEVDAMRLALVAAGGTL